MKKVIYFVSTLIFLCTLNGLGRAIQFEEVTETAGVSFIGGSWGASWGDFNGDGKPDIWVSDCSSPTRLRLNNGDGTFRDASDVIIGTSEDTHGAAWADFDNDGEQDLLQLVGGGRGVGSGPNQLFVNTQNLLRNLAVEYGLDYPLGRGRTPLWFDWNGDGYLDVFLANDVRTDGHAPSALFTNDQGFFVNHSSLTGITTEQNNLYAQLAHLGTEYIPILMIYGHDYCFPERAYDVSTLPFEEISENFGFIKDWSYCPPSDTAIADLDGDLINDIFLALKKENCQSQVELESTTIKARIHTGGLEKGLSFRTQGSVSFNIPTPGTVPFIVNDTHIFLRTDDIYIGQDGHHPSDFFFTLEPAEAFGIFPHSPDDPAVFIGYDSTTTLWQVNVSGFPASNMMVHSQTPILDLETIGFTSCDRAKADSLLVFKSEMFQDMTAQSGLDFPSACGSVVAADFDNDMDIDLYLLCRSLIMNLPNRLYENLGNATFNMISNAGGAEGSTIGRGDSVATADYDEDGFVDLFVTNGFGEPPFDKGPDQLFRNRGNANNWIEIDLEGVLSNRDGIGTRLFVTAGGVTQFREQMGGIHARSQNYQRIHFGLAENERVDKLIIEWPSGMNQEILELPANQIIRVVEPSFTSPFGKPSYNPGVDDGVYFWKETFDGPYHLRVSGNGPLSIFKVEVLADQPFVSLMPIKLEDDDDLFWEDNYLSFTSRVTTGEDGIDFVLPPVTEALISVEQDGHPNPRQLHIGISGQPTTPTGWILSIDQLSSLPIFQPGNDLGLFVGIGSFPGEILTRWNGDGYNHIANLKIVSSDIFQDIQTVNFEPCCDSLITDAWSASVLATMNSWWDGLDIKLPGDSTIGISYLQDGLFQSHRINKNAPNLGTPDAYALPLPSIFGKPVFQPAQDKYLFVWKDDANSYHLRATVGGGYGRYQGDIVSSLPVITAQAWLLEPHDVLEVSEDKKRITFDLQVWGGAQDGIDIILPEGSQLSLELNGNTTEAASLVRIGCEKWPVESLPVVLAK